MLNRKPDGEKYPRTINCFAYRNETKVIKGEKITKEYCNCLSALECKERYCKFYKPSVTIAEDNYLAQTSQPWQKKYEKEKKCKTKK